MLNNAEETVKSINGLIDILMERGETDLGLDFYKLKERIQKTVDEYRENPTEMNMIRLQTAVIDTLCLIISVKFK